MCYGALSSTARLDMGGGGSWSCHKHGTYFRG